MGWQAGDELNGGKYRVARTLNEGRVGISYLADRRGDHAVVLKTVRDAVWARLTPPEQEKFNNKLIDEAVKLARCQHPHIVGCLGSFIEQGRAFIVMAYAAGQDLASLPTKKLGEEDALVYIRQVGEALKVVHREGLVHRDVKPANIVLRAGKPEAVLIDFGVTKGFNETLTSIYSSNTDGYSPLELYDPTEKARPYCDVYGLAATLYTLLSGDVPPHAEERARLDRRGRRLPPIAGVSDKTNRAIGEGMALDYGDRPSTIEAFLALLPDAPPTVEPSPPPVASSQPPSSQRIDPGLRVARDTLYVTIVSVVVAVILGIFAQDIRKAIDAWFFSPGVEQNSEP